MRRGSIPGPPFPCFTQTPFIVIAPSLPEGLQQALNDIREGIHLRWNPTAVLIASGSFDASGKLKKDPQYDPRWELWDTDAEGKEYKIMSIQWPNGEFRRPDFWLVELINYMNPARYGGNINRMLREMVDEPNAELENIAERDIDDLIEMAAKWHYYADQPKQRVLTSIS
jgi:hypothetical protein